MDADGQDDPEYLVNIIKESKKNPERTITVNRTKREDELKFKICYQIYLFLSFLLTSKYLKFGVYSYLHSSSLDKILSTNDIYFAYPAALAKHFKNKNVIFAPRKKRIFGESQNNYKSLTYYALKIISVFRNQVLVNSIALVFISFLLSKFIISSTFFLFILLTLLFLNIIIFLLANQINKSHIIKDTLTNIENIENLRNWTFIMNIHEYQAKNLLKEFGAPVPKGVVIYDIKEVSQKIKTLSTDSLVIKAQIHAGGRGKVGGIKLVKANEDLIKEASNMFGKTLITHQTGPQGKKVRRLYIEEASEIQKEFYLSCLVDRTSSKIAFISSTEGGMEIEKVAKQDPEKIITTKFDLKDEIAEHDFENIIKVFKLNNKQRDQAKKLINSIFNLLIQKDANLVEINPLIVTKSANLCCLDAKINFDDNAMFRHPEILKLRDLDEEDPTEIEAREHDLAYIKLNGSIGCMVNGAGLAMATMDIIKLYGKEPANFLDVGGGASKEKVAEAFKIILSDKNVKGILINIFGGIMRCDVLAKGVVEAAKEIKLNVPLVVRLAGTNFEEGKKILSESNLKILSATDLHDAAKKIVEVVR